MGKKGLALVFVLGIIAILIVIASAFGTLTSGETQMVRRQTNSIRAFYLAEAGIEKAIYNLSKGEDYNDFSDKLYSGINEYTVDITPNTPPPGSITTYTINSTGGYPNLSASDKVTRRVQIDVSVQPNGDPSRVTNAIEANGSITTSGAVTINGGIKPNSTLNFESIFKITKEQMEAMADNKYTDPPNNKMPVDKITWVNLSSTNSNFRISETGWSGEGILVVTAAPGATSPALEIEGGVFNGVVWVIGNLRISGNGVINGGIFVENGSAEVTKLTGTPVINYDSTKVAAAFSHLGNSVTNISNWREVL